MKYTVVSGYIHISGLPSMVKIYQDDVSKEQVERVRKEAKSDIITECGSGTKEGYLYGTEVVPETIKNPVRSLERRLKTMAETYRLTQ